MKKKILIVEDEKDFSATIKEFFEESGEYEVCAESNGSKALEAIKDFKPHLIILDVMLPGMNGFEICKRIRENEKFHAIPIIMLTAKQDEPDKIAGLDIGADDYVTKPCSLFELRSRIRAILRRQEPEKKNLKVSAGNVKIDLTLHEVTINGKKVDLTIAEFKILELLASHPGRAFKRETILEHLWEGEKIVVGRTVDVHIRHLRKKLGNSGKCVRNIRGIGYKFERRKDE